MDVAAGQLSSPAELLNCYNSGVPCPKPPPSKLPAYSAERYKAFVQASLYPAGSTYKDHKPLDGTSFKIDTSEDTSNFKFGQTTMGASARTNGWFSFYSASAGKSTTTTNLRTGSAASSVDVKIFYDKLEAITIAPGSW
jgi:hypothetical protein